LQICKRSFTKRCQQSCFKTNFCLMASYFKHFLFRYCLH
jgi:hypothetical protein